MGKNARIIIIAVVVAIVGGALYFTYGGMGGCSSQPAADSKTPSGGDQTPAAAGVAIQNFAFDPETVTIAAGGTVTWANRDALDHRIASDAGAFESLLLADGQTFTFTFAAPGTYTYHCPIHPSMKGTVIVR